jgi:hypothetical protein
MDENLNSVNAEPAEVVDSQTADTATEVVTGESESAVPAEQPTTEEKTAEQPKPEPKKQTPEENAAFKALRLEERQRAEQKARDAVFAKMAKENNWTGIDGKPIQTEADYNNALDDNKKLVALVNSGVSEETARLQVQIDQLQREKAERETAAQESIRKESDRNAFFEYFKEVNGRQITEADIEAIPPEVFEKAHKENIPLKYVYADHFAKQQLDKSKRVESGKSTAQANETNATTAAGSVTGNGAAENSVLTEAIINSMTDKQRIARWPEIKKFYNMK